LSSRAFALFAFALLLCAVAPAGAIAQTPPTGGTAYQPPAPPPPPTPTTPVPLPQSVLPQQTVPGVQAQLMPNGLAAAPADAPPQVQNAIWAANELQELPYKYGGGHRRFIDKGYDCSGTVSWALHFAGLLDHPLDSSSFMSWGEAGKGQWFTVYTNPGHAFVIIAGLRLDTSAAGVTAAVARRIPTANENGPRWRPTLRSTRGYRARHPLGW
jgi:hypothetical protein